MAATEDAESVFVTKHFAVFRFCPKQTCQGFQDDFTHCGCEEQCEVLMEYQEQYGQNGGNADDDGENQEENCQAACYEQCKIWGVQQDLNDGTYDSSNSGYYNRKLDDNNANGRISSVVNMISVDDGPGSKEEQSINVDEELNDNVELI